MQFPRVTANMKSMQIPAFPVVPAQAFAPLVLRKKHKQFSSKKAVCHFDDTPSFSFNP
jgi:hypothetical protein